MRGKILVFISYSKDIEKKDLYDAGLGNCELNCKIKSNKYYI